MTKIFVLMLMLVMTTVQAGDLVLEHVSVVDVKNLTVVPDQTVWISGQNIKAIESTKSARKSIPKDLTRLDLSGQYLTPGLIDAHVHHATDPDRYDNRDRTLQYYRHYLRHGITAVRDMGGDARVLMGYQREALLDNIQAPDIHFSAIIAGPEFFTDPRTVASSRGHQSGTVPWIRSITHDTDWTQIIQQAQGMGATGIKIYRELPGDILEPLVTEALKQGIQVWSHTYIYPATPMDAVKAGVQVVSHADGLSGTSKRDVTTWFEQGGRDYRKLLKGNDHQQILTQLLEQDVILDATLVIFEQLGQQSELTQVRYELAKAMTKAAHQKGIKITTGTDFPVRDLADEPMLYRELKLLVEDVGMRPIEAIQAATWHAALALGIDETHGQVTVGRRANLLVFDQDPTTDIEHLSSLSHVLKNGQMVYRGMPPGLPFSAARKAGDQLWLSGQLGNVPGTKTLVAGGIQAEMQQTMINIGHVLQEHQLDFDDLLQCTLMLADMDEWGQANEIYRSFFRQNLPARSAFAAAGLALDARVELTCVAQL